MRAPSLQWPHYAALVFLVMALVFFVLWTMAERRARVGFENGWIAYFMTELGAPQCHIANPFFRPDLPRTGPFVPSVAER